MIPNPGVHALFYTKLSQLPELSLPGSACPVLLGFGTGIGWVLVLWERGASFPGSCMGKGPRAPPGGGCGVISSSLSCPRCFFSGLACSGLLLLFSTSMPVTRRWARLSKILCRVNSNSGCLNDSREQKASRPAQALL